METLTQPETVVATLQGPHGMLGFRLFKNDSCFQIAHEIFAGRTYPHVPFVQDVKTVVDIGANIGAASFFFATICPDATVYALEPGSRPYSLLKENVAGLPNVRVFPFGLSSSAQKASLYAGRHDCVESSICPTGRTTSDCEPVELRAAAQFVGEQGLESIDILKLDTEGCEVPVLQSLKKYLPAIKILYVEYHSERDRRLIDAMLTESHTLWRAQVALVYRGEFCYLRRDLIPGADETHTCEILLPLEER